MQRSLRNAGFRELIFDAGEVRINYLEGPNNGQALLLIPGQGLSLESYQRVLAPLSKTFHVFAVDVRGHGKSGWTTGNYNFPAIGGDFKGLLEHVILRPAIISGNSSGGLIALWLAANVPDKVRGIILEDTPVFSAEWPRLRDDCWAFRLFSRMAETVGSPKGRDLASLFKGLEVPMEGKQKVIQFPSWLTGTMSLAVRLSERLRPGKPVDIFFLPPETRMLIKSLSVYDPDFTRSFVDGRAYIGFDHATALQNVKCPILLLQANWFRHPEFGLVGSMDDKDLARFRSLAPHAEYQRIVSGHMIHFEKPKEYKKMVNDFSKQLANREGGKEFLYHPACSHKSDCTA